MSNIGFVCFIRITLLSFFCYYLFDIINVTLSNCFVKHFFTKLCTKCNSSAGWLNCYGIWQASHLNLPNSIPVVLFLTVSAANAQTYLNYYHQIPFLTHEFSKSMKSMQPLQILNGIIYGTIQLFHKYIYKTPEGIFSLRKYIISGPLVNDITKAIKY